MKGVGKPSRWQGSSRRRGSASHVLCSHIQWGKSVFNLQSSDCVSWSGSRQQGGKVEALALWPEQLMHPCKTSLPWNPSLSLATGMGTWMFLE